jgi:nitrate reductase gamma subunit
MTDVIFVILGYGVILGGLAGYAALLLRRLSAARAAERSTQRDDTEA